MEEPHRLPFTRTFLALAIVAIFDQAAPAQPCKASDGNCAVLLLPPDINWSDLNLPAPQSIAGDLALGPDRPGMLGAITFRGGGSACIGLMRRGGCK